MRPLARATTEFRCIGLAWLAVGVALFAIEVSGARHPAAAVAGVILTAVIWVICQRLRLSGRYMEEALASPPELDSPEIEPRSKTVLRVVARGAVLLAIYVALVLALDTLALAAGFALGGAVDDALILRRLCRFESSRGLLVLRDPRWRWRRNRAEQRFGRGIMDAQDYYVTPVRR
jgi:hypothetical protein